MLNDVENMIEVLEVLERSVHGSNYFSDDDNTHIINMIEYKWDIYRNPISNVKIIVISSDENKTMFRINFGGNDIVRYFYLAGNIVTDDFDLYANVVKTTNINYINTYDQYFQQSTIQDLSWITFEQLSKLNTIVNLIIDKVE